MNTNKVRTSDTDDDDEQVGNEGVSSGVETRGILGSIAKMKTRGLFEMCLASPEMYASRRLQ